MSGGFVIGQHAPWRRNLRAENAQSYWLRQAQWEDPAPPLQSWLGILTRFAIDIAVACAAAWAAIELLDMVGGLP